MTMTKKPEITIDAEAILAAIRDGTGLTGKDGALTPLIKQLTEAAMQAELDDHLANESEPTVRMVLPAKQSKGPRAVSN